MSTVDDLMARVGLLTVRGAWADAQMAHIRAALESALKAEYERGRRQGITDVHDKLRVEHEQAAEPPTPMGWLESPHGAFRANPLVRVVSMPPETLAWQIPLYFAPPKCEQGEPVAYFCPVGCGCLWRDNKDGSMSLFSGKHRSCEVCENTPLDQLTPLYASPPKREPLAGCSDLRDAKRLDPECCEAGACQSLRFKNKREPLTDERIELWADSFIRKVAFNRPVAIQIATKAARWAERAHGIGETP